MRRSNSFQPSTISRAWSKVTCGFITARFWRLEKINPLPNMTDNPPRILLSTTVPVHFRAFHLPWVKRLRELGCVVRGAADRISEMPECVTAFNQVRDIPFSRNPLKLGAARAAGRAIAKLMADEKIDLVHVHTPVSSFVTLQSAQRLRRTRGLKTVYTAHGLLFHPRGLPHTNFIFKFFERIMCRWSDYLV